MSPKNGQEHRKIYSRREARKNERLEKKRRNALYHEKKRKDGEESGNKNINDEATAMKQLRRQHEEKKRQLERKKRMEILKKAAEIRSARNKIKFEDKIIRKMEKKLGLNKRHRKKNTFPKSFYNDGLGDILDLIDKRVEPDDLKNEVYNTGELINEEEEEVESEEDMDDVANDEGVQDEDEVESDQVEDDGEEGDDADDSEMIEENDEIEDEGDEESSNKHKIEVEEQPDPDLLRKVRGQLNRVTSSNLPSIASFIENLYHQNSMYQVNQSICQVIDNMIVIGGMLSSLKLVSELSMLITTLHENVGEEVGGHAIHYFVKRFDSLLQESKNSVSKNYDEDDKRLDNCLAILVHLYACCIVEVGLINDIVKELISVFDEKSIQLLSFVIVTVGFILRKDSPESLKTLIRNLQLKASEYSSKNDSEEHSNKRIEFMLESMTALKNNNILKITQRSSGVYSPIDRDEIRSILKNCLKKSTKISSIPATFQQVLASNRWWIKVGTLLENERHQSLGSRSKKKTVKFEDSNEMSNREEKLCRSLRLNTTPLRRNLFYTLISSTDYIEASDRMISVCPKNQTSEIANVIFQAAIHKTTFNPYYLHICRRISSIDRRYKLSIFFAIKDRVSTMMTDESAMTPKRRQIFAEMIFELLKHRVVNLTILKGIDFSLLSEPLVEFLRSVLSRVINDSDESLMMDTFNRIPKKDHSFVSHLRLFINCFMDESASSITKELLKHKIRHKK